MVNGYIYLHKKMMDSSIWKTQEQFDKRSAWVDLLLLANYEDREAMSNSGEVITVRKGQHLTSQDALALRWKWSRGKVHRFLEHLKSADMINFEHVRWGKGATLITIQNYWYYQCYEEFANDKRTKNERKPEHRADAERYTPNKYNKTNKINEDKPEDFWL